MEKVYQSANLVDAQLVMDQLQANHIEAIIKDGYLVGAIGGLPADTTPSIWVVDGNDKQRAENLVKTIEQVRKQTSQEWQCTNCDEQLDASFEVCWRCGETGP